MTSEIIQNLDDITAQEILGAMARSRARAIDQNVPWSASLGQALAHEFHVDQGTALVSEGDLARLALLLLADDPETRAAIEAMAASKESAQKFDFGATIGLTAAALRSANTCEFRARFGWEVEFEGREETDQRRAVEGLGAEATELCEIEAFVILANESERERWAFAALDAGFAPPKADSECQFSTLSVSDCVACFGALQ